MKQSKYNFFFDLPVDGNVLAFNALKNGLALLKPAVVDKIKALQYGDTPELNEKLLQELSMGGFICDDDLDEYRLLLVRRNIHQYSNSGLGLTLVPSLECNLACKYCFEPEVTGAMTDETVEQIVTFADSYIKSGIKHLSVSWYGGEPLLYTDIIETLSNRLIKICKDGGVDYSAYIVTNGVHLNRDTAEKLAGLNVTGAQVTIDGDRDTHNQRRPFKDGSGSFQQILANIKSVAGLIPLSIRINVDKSNIDKAIPVVEQLKAEKGIKEHLGKKIKFHYGYVRKYTSACRCSKEENLKAGDFYKKEFELYKHLKEQGDDFDHYPVPSFGCSATSLHSYVVAPGGELFKCWNHIGFPELKVGTIFEPVQMNPLYLDYLTESFDSDRECKECKFLPLCMGGCVDVRVKAKRGEMENKDCTGWKYYLEESLREYYTSRI